MEARIRELRKVLGLTQQEFSEKIGVKRNTIAQYETGRNAPIDAVISLICREFGVNEIWLREGVGEMFRQKSRSEEIAEFFADIQSSDPGFKKAFVTVLARMGPEEWKMIEAKAMELMEEIKKAGPCKSRCPQNCPGGIQRFDKGREKRVLVKDLEKD